MSADYGGAGDDGTAEMYQNLDEDFNILYIEKDGKRVTYVEEALRLITLSLIERFVAAIEASDKDGFVEIVKEKEKEKEKEKTVIETLDLGKHFKSFKGFLNARSDDYIFSEKVMLFFAACKLFDMAAEDFKYLGEPSVVNNEQMLWQRCNAFIAHIRKECKSPQFKRRVSYRAAGAHENYESGVAYVDRLFKVKSRYLVIRVDLGYLKDCHTEVDLMRVRSDFEKMLNNRRSNKLFKEMAGYIWKLEYGAQKGYHYHCIFFFNGAVVEQDSYYAEMIGKYWVNKITRGAGTMFNCNAKKNKYKHCGIGMIDRTDVEKIDLLLRYPLKYLTKKEQFLAMKLASKPRLFGRGKMPPLPAQKLGRPRQD
jgi:hypothetical protein